ncbi:MAG: hypothetical protein ACPL07_04465 [Candidatus Bathyarchaeia archaeon]
MELKRNMVKTTLSKMYVVKRKAVNGRSYAAYFLYLPSKLTNDSAFPFKPSERVRLTVKGRQMIVEAVKRPTKTPKGK